MITKIKPEEIPYIPNRPVPWIQSISLDGEVDVRFNSSLLFGDSVALNETGVRRLSDKFEM